MTSAPSLVLVTDPRWDDDRIVCVTELVCGSVARACVQLRDRERDDDAVLRLAMRLREVTMRLGAMLLVNRRLSVARACMADGAHVPVLALAEARAALGPLATLSAPAHSDEDVERACEEGASMVLVSPIFATPGKGVPRGLHALDRARQIARGRAAIVALGGVDEANARACLHAGADAVAAIRALLDAKNPEQVAARMARRADVC